MLFFLFVVIDCGLFYCLLLCVQVKRDTKPSRGWISCQLRWRRKPTRTKRPKSPFSRNHSGKREPTWRVWTRFTCETKPAGSSHFLPIKTWFPSTKGQTEKEDLTSALWMDPLLKTWTDSIKFVVLFQRFSAAEALIEPEKTFVERL